MPNDYVTTSYLDEKIAQLNKRFDDLFQKLDWFAGKYSKVDQTQEMQAKNLADLDERVETLEKQNRLVVQ